MGFNSGFKGLNVNSVVALYNVRYLEVIWRECFGKGKYRGSVRYFNIVSCMASPTGNVITCIESTIGSVESHMESLTDNVVSHVKSPIDNVVTYLITY